MSTKVEIPEKLFEMLLNIIQEQNTQLAEIIFNENNLPTRINVPSKAEIRKMLKIYSSSSSSSDVE
jgi:hypothetical protein